MIFLRNSHFNEGKRRKNNHKVKEWQRTWASLWRLKFKLLGFSTENQIQTDSILFVKSISHGFFSLSLSLPSVCSHSYSRRPNVIAYLVLLKIKSLLRRKKTCKRHKTSGEFDVSSRTNMNGSLNWLSSMKRTDVGVWSHSNMETEGRQLNSPSSY